MEREDFVERILDCLSPILHHLERIRKATDRLKKGELAEDWEDFDVVTLEVYCDHLLLDLEEIAIVVEDCAYTYPEKQELRGGSKSDVG